MKSKNYAKIARSTSPIRGWALNDSDHEFYEIGLEAASRHAGKKCAYIKSRAEDDSQLELRDAYCHFKQACGVDKYRGKRIRMTAWAKSALSDSGLGRLELNVIGTWGSFCKWNGTFDNMDDTPILGATEWKQYSLVVDVPEDSISIGFGLNMIGIGKMWLDEFNIEIVDRTVPLTGLLSEPANLNFDE